MYVLEETKDKRVYEWCQSNHSDWRKDLTVEQYVGRERASSLTRICDVNRSDDQEHGIRYWILRDTSIKTDSLTGNIVSSCETLHRKSWKFLIGEEMIHREDVISPCIGSVYTLGKHRGKGACNLMISQLCSHFEKELGDDNFITLYSEIGNYYEKFGFKNHYIPKAVIPIPEKEIAINSHITFISDEFESLIGLYNGRFLKNIYQKMGKDHANKIANVPNVDIVDWHHERTRYVHRTVNGGEVQKFGVVYKNDQDIINGFIIFNYDFYEKDIYLLMVYADNLEIFKYLLDGVLKIGQDMDFKSISSWESDLFNYKILLDENDESNERDQRELKEYIEELGGELNVENSSLSAVKLINDDNDIEWCGNGKWAWF